MSTRRDQESSYNTESGVHRKAERRHRMEKDILVNTFDETQEEVVPAGGIERIVAEIDEDATDSLWEQVAPDEEETPEVVEEAEEVDVDLEPGKDESLDPMRLYLREMSTVPLLTREDEIRIAKRIERGQIRIYKALSRSFITLEEIERMEVELAEERLNPQEVVDVATDPEAEEALKHSAKRFASGSWLSLSKLQR